MKNNAMSNEERFDARLLIPLLIMGIVEYEVFTFSKATVAAAEQDAWIAILLGALIGSIFVYLFVKLASRFPNKGYFEYLQIVWGRPIGFGISMLYLLFFVVFLSSIFYETILANKMLFLPRTPELLHLLIFAASLIWLVSLGFGTILRFFHILLPFMVIPLLLLAVLFLTAIDIGNFTPVLENGVVPVLKGSYYFLGAYQGPEILLFAAPFFIKIKKAVKPSLVAYNTTAFFGWSNSAAAIGILGVANIKEAILPGINVVNILQFPGFPVERFGLLLTLPWLIAIYTTLLIYLHLLCTNTIQLFNLPKKKIFIILLTALPVVIAYFLPDESWHEKLRMYLTIVTVPIVYIIPVMTLALAIVRKKGRTA